MKTTLNSMTESSSRQLGFAVIVAAAIIILIWGIRGLAGILNPILLAAVITITLLPVPRALEARGLKSGTSLLITIVLVVVFIVGFAWLVLASINQMDDQVPTYTAGFQAQNEAAARSMDMVDQLVQSVMRTLNSDKYSQAFATLISFLGATISQLFVTLLIFVFMLYTALSLPNLSRLGIEAESGAVDQMIDLTSDVRRYMALTAGINLLVGIADAILLWILGVPYALLWGLIAWVLGFIPAVGYWIALIPPVLLSYSLYGAQTALIVFIGYAVINGTAANIISPRVLGKGLRISPLVVFVSVFVWGWLLGAIGAILAIPLTMVIITLLGSFDNTRWVSKLMSFVPGGDKQLDAEAFTRVKGLAAQLRERLPTPTMDVPAETEVTIPKISTNHKWKNRA